jgi:hypothetical protein
VEGNHNFIANGVLVHNCLWGGDPGKAWADKIKKQMEAADQKTASLGAGALTHELMNDLASAYRGKRMRDAIRDMELAEVPQVMAEEVYRKVGQHADEVRGNLHRLLSGVRVEFEGGDRPGWVCSDETGTIFVPADGSPPPHGGSIALRSVAGAMHEWCKTDVLRYGGANLTKMMKSTE